MLLNKLRQIAFEANQKVAQTPIAQRDQAYQKWLEYKSEHQTLSDQLNRARLFFFEIDHAGHLFRLGLDKTQENLIREGRVSNGETLNQILANIQLNKSSLGPAHATTLEFGSSPNEWHWLSTRGAENYFIRCTDHSSKQPGFPIVFHHFSMNLIFKKLIMMNN
mmetsp:Transcript_6057/g.9430  ORF Transcript_6057/g.9430 Transcript_6057/m.9430 type:complete len:164 (-) Transcript_6057:1416-1907(-)